MRRGVALGVLAFVVAAAAPAARAEQPVWPPAWRVGADGGPAWARKAVRWTGPDKATDLHGFAVGLRVDRTEQLAGLWAWAVGGALGFTELSDRHFAPTPTLVVDDLTARQTAFLAVAELRCGGWLHAFVQGGLGLTEIDVHIEYAPGGPPTTHHRDTELAARVSGGIGVAVGALTQFQADPFVPARLTHRFEARVGFEWFWADDSVMAPGGVSLGGYRPDHFAVRFGLAWWF